MNATIPPDINTLDRLTAAQFYATTLGWAVHPLLAADRGEPQERGKKPLLKGWRNHIAEQLQAGTEPGQHGHALFLQARKLAPVNFMPRR